MIYTSPLYLHEKYRPNKTNGIEKKNQFINYISTYQFYLLPKVLKKRMDCKKKNISRSIILDYYFNQKKFFSVKKF